MAFIPTRTHAAPARMTGAAAPAMGVVTVAKTAQHGPEDTDFPRTYREWRRAYYDRFPAFWGTIPGESREEYAGYGALEVPREHVRAPRTASARLYQLLTRLALTLQQAEDQSLIDVGIPRPALPYCQIIMSAMPAVMCGRFEFVMTAEWPTLLEFNAETPTFVVEHFHMNDQVCADFGLVDPNIGRHEQLARAIHAAITAGLSWVEPNPGDAPSVVFTSSARRREARATTEYYRSL